MQTPHNPDIQISQSMFIGSQNTYGITFVLGKNI